MVSVAVFAVFFVFFIGAFVPVVPEMFAFLAFLKHPTPTAGFFIILSAAVGDVLGNWSFYRLLKRFGMPSFLERWIRRYTDFLVIKGEKIVLWNRAVPLVPVVGPFVIACRWSPRKTLGYVALGGAIKNILLFVLAAPFHSLYDRKLGIYLSLAAFALVLLISYFAKYFVPSAAFPPSQK